MRIFAFSLLLVLALSACSEPVMNPKPRAYPRIEYPDRTYSAFSLDACNFSFQYPAYARIVQDSTFFEKSPPHPCWFNLYYPDFNGNIHFSYYQINQPKSFDELKADAFEMVDWHNKKANYIEERAIRLPNGVSGYAFNIEGPAASPFQFYLTDSTRHFLRGALYFESSVNPDSIAPVLEFVREDIIKLIDTFTWK